jgi:hypothetical protein
MTRSYLVFVFRLGEEGSDQPIVQIEDLIGRRGRGGCRAKSRRAWRDADQFRIPRAGLMSAVEEVAREEGKTVLVLDTVPTGGDAERLYELIRTLHPSACTAIQISPAEEIVNTVTRIGVDLAKNVMQPRCADELGQVVIRKSISPDRLSN